MDTLCPVELPPISSFNQVCQVTSAWEAQADEVEALKSTISAKVSAEELSTLMTSRSAYHVVSLLLRTPAGASEESKELYSQVIREVTGQLWKDLSSELSCPSYSTTLQGHLELFVDILRVGRSSFQFDFTDKDLLLMWWCLEQLSVYEAHSSILAKSLWDMVEYAGRSDEEAARKMYNMGIVRRLAGTAKQLSGILLEPDHQFVNPELERSNPDPMRSTNFSLVTAVCGAWSMFETQLSKSIGESYWIERRAHISFLRRVCNDNVEDNRSESALLLEEQHYDRQYQNLREAVVDGWLKKCRHSIARRKAFGCLHPVVTS